MTSLQITEAPSGDLIKLGNGITIDVIGNPAGQPAVFLCGWGMSTDAYHERLTELGKDLRIYAISLPGFGRNNPLTLKDTNVPAYATLMAETIEHLGLPMPFPIMGHSTGGGVAALIAKQHPDWISDLILVTPIGSAERAPGGTKQLILDWYGREDMTLLDVENLKRNALHATVLAWNAIRINLIQDVTDVVNHGTPVHMILSKADYIAPPGTLGDIPGATVHWVEGGHTWFRRNEEEFIHLVRTTLIREETAPRTPLTLWARLAIWLTARFAGK